MPVDPLIAPILAALNQVERPALAELDAIELRRQVESRSQESSPYAALVEDPPEVADVYEASVEVTRPPGRIPVTVYRTDRAMAGEAQGALVMFHGGGWFMGNREGSDVRCKTIAAALDLVVVNVEYRLAPEHPFPTPPEDCYESYIWTASNLDALGVQGKWLAVAGESAGGNLAAAVSLLARERGGPRIALQVLEIPGLDLTMSSPSVATYGRGHVLDKDELGWCARNYLGGNDAKDPIASPLWAPDLSGLPPAVILTAECDPLADDGRRYAEKLTAAGVPVTYREFPGHVHGSHTLTKLLPTAREWRETLLSAIRDSMPADANR